MAVRVFTALAACALLSGCVIDPYYDQPQPEQPRVKQSQSRYPNGHYQTYRPQPQPSAPAQQVGRPTVDDRYRNQPAPDQRAAEREMERQMQRERYREQEIEPDTGPSRPAPSTGRASRDQGNSASSALLQQAAQARAQGNYARAQSLAERAQSIAPQDAESYAELARIYRAQGDTNRAQQMARRGLSVGSTNPQTLRELQQLSR